MGEITLDAVRQLAVDSGFAKPNVDATRSLAQRVDMDAMFTAFGVKNMCDSERALPVASFCSQQPLFC